MKNTHDVSTEQLEVGALAIGMGLAAFVGWVLIHPVAAAGASYVGAVAVGAGIEGVRRLGA